MGGLYQSRIQHDINVTQKEYEYQTKKIECIQLVQQNGVDVIMEDNEFSNLPISEFKKLKENQKKADALAQKIKELKLLSAKELWTKELMELKNKLVLKKRNLDQV